MGSEMCIRDSCDHRFDDLVSPRTGGVLVDTTDRVTGLDDAEIGSVEALGDLIGEPSELLGGDDDRRDAHRLELHGVVDTPRRAAASIGSTGEDDLHSLS